MTPPTSLASDCTHMSRNMVQMGGGIAYNVAARTQDTCCKTCCMPQLGTTGGLSIVPVKEIYTSQVGPIDQLTGSGIMMLGSSSCVRVVPKHVIGLKRTWDQRLSSGLLLTFMTTDLFQFRFVIGLTRPPASRRPARHPLLFPLLPP